MSYVVIATSMRELFDLWQFFYKFLKRWVEENG